MSLLTMTPESWASWDFVVHDGPRTLAKIGVSWWKEKGVLSLENQDYRVFREGVLNGDFILERSGTTLARATKPSMFSSSFELKFNDRHYTLRKRSVWRRGFALMVGDREVGAITPRSMWARDAIVDLPDDWPAHIKVFATWLVIILWKREANSGAAAG